MKLKYTWFDSQEDKVRVYYTPRKTPTRKELQPSSLIFLLINKNSIKIKAYYNLLELQQIAWVAQLGNVQSYSWTR